MTFYRGKGCKQCNDDGYKGRLGIYEIFEVTPEVSDLILNRASARDLTKAALGQGMLTMLEDGFMKAVKGITTLEEVLLAAKE
jgi:type IV pilus assembly protein PilB